MPAFVSPLIDPAAWTYSITELTLPLGLRYGGYKVRALQATNSVGANLVMPALGILRRATHSDGREIIEVQTDPFPIRRVVLGLTGGVPTFYLVLPDASGLTVSNDQIGQFADVLKTGATTVSIAVVFQDRVTRDPALWTAQILAAINGVAGSNATLWEPFATAVNTQTNTGNRAPVLLLDHTGAPVTSGSVDLLFGSLVRNVTMDPADMGDLQRTVRRLNAADPGLWSGATNFIIRPVKDPDEEVQLTLLENPVGAINQIQVTPAQRHVLSTKVTDWIAEQFAIPTGQIASPLARYSRGNKVTALVNGPAFFDDLFHRLQEARVANGRFDLAGWAMFAETEFAKRGAADPADFPLTLEQAVQLISDAGGSSRLLAAQFVQLEPGASDIANDEILAFFLIVSGVLILSSLGVSFLRTDVMGAFILVGLLFANGLLMSILLENAEGLGPAPNQDTVDLLDPITRVGCALAPFPAHVDDNTAIATPGGFPFDTVFRIMRRFGVYHQKFAVVRTDTGHFGYCGGIDLNPDRLDDENHLVQGVPYHDVHTKVEGPAVRDLSISFNERWTRDGSGDVLTFDPPSAATLGTPGSDIVQVARTYFAAADPSRQLAFAPNGDRTIADSMLAAIEQAREFIYIEDQYLTPPQAYRQALIDKVTNGEIKKLIIAIPGITDQPFGEIVRTQLITDLRAADAGRGIFLVGYPRRRYTVSENELRSSSGKCILGQNLPAVSGLDDNVVLKPAARVPVPPFWLSVEGELMWVYDEAIGAPPTGTKRLKVVRGPDTRFVKGGVSPVGTSMRAHSTGAAATVIDLTNIYVHAKLMIVDDVFLGVGSANLNRRGLFHDGELNIFTMPEALKAIATNPIVALREKLWAEMLDLPGAMASGLLADPVAAAKLFERSPFFGNRFVDIDAYPNHLMFGASTGDGLVATLLQLFVTGLVAVDHVKLFDAVVDPSSAVESA
jgi:phosphatidylserine/phosphatidylglycerophosphate/cardiolipin synthase-like enzyme